MAIRVLIAILFVTAVSCNDEACRLRPDCGTPRLFFPGSQEELDEFCSSLIQSVTCVKDHYIKCEEEELRLNQIEYALTALKNVCDKDGQIYKGLARHISCIKDSFQTYNLSCKGLQKETVESPHLKNVLKEEDSYKIRCLGDAVYIACMLEKIGRSCSLTAERTVLRVINQFKNEIDFCYGPDLPEIGELAEIIELEETIKIRVTAVLDSFKE